MAVDRIGKNGPPVQIPEAAGTPRAHPSGAVFQVPAPAPAAPPAPIGAAGASPVAGTSAVGGPLERLRAGEVDLGGYVDLKVHEATAHLSALPPVQLESIRSALRERLSSDPSLVELLHTATGEALPPDDD